MAPLNEEQLQQIRDERKEQIIEAALKVFARRGIIGTKMSMIASEAGISAGLLYRYFKSKDELFTTLVQQAIDESITGIKSIYQLPGSPLDKIKTLTAEILNEGSQLYFMLMHHARTSDEVPITAKKIIEENTMKTYIDILEPLFIEGQKKGELVEDNPSELISCYLSLLSGLMTLNIQGDENYQMPKVDLLLRFVVRPS
ncbi:MULTISPECIES: TetR/AcrR family transcriptional regulator [Metabacillus]|uniref:TetR/AcrR family transcriptional regulator n=1 Tax=Metabacillus hrfriensis TaxID=3048891 RepID=A0ACD4RIW2_9BACI|nr:MULTISPECIES: TetR/AcrR family transcriptional regulator [Metabacillus]UAL54586.1 TetR/AcrR family transcriptional regulator [Metabacillus dongyingensis]UOK59724.1 TetR/AcrR family transcriptional regulator [Bacillus sp. OVS6]USK30916.1 TetR/AcrR family transcriptional regulator [Bacillus sp. CMF21]WHZ60152.1 TetR/AcrR family transcriptional regulator [Metabacillus sp. CT-WN-B3]